MPQGFHVQNRWKISEVIQRITQCCLRIFSTLWDHYLVTGQSTVTPEQYFQQTSHMKRLKRSSHHHNIRFLSLEQDLGISLGKYN